MPIFEVLLMMTAQKQRDMKTVTMNIKGQTIETKKFKTLKAANNFIKKANNREVVYFRAHEYYVNI